MLKNTQNELWRAVAITRHEKYHLLTLKAGQAILLHSQQPEPRGPSFIIVAAIRQYNGERIPFDLLRCI